MVARKDKLVQAAAALALFTCTLCPFVEMLFHSDNSIFVSGHDTESTLALVLLLIELSFAIARLLVGLLPAIFEKLASVSFDTLVQRVVNFAIVFPTVSPPVPLRI